jgi:hypothetical protein
VGPDTVALADGVCTGVAVTTTGADVGIAAGAAHDTTIIINAMIINRLAIKRFISSSFFHVFGSVPGPLR